MSYNVKVQFFPDEIQLSLYDYRVGDDFEVIKQPQKSKKRRDFDDFTECSEICEQPFNDDKPITKASGEIVSLRSIRRTKQTIYDYARSNMWEWFSTFTFSSDRYDYDVCLARLSNFLSNFKKRYINDLQWLIVPEQHKDGAWHFHGLFIGDLKPFLTSSFESGRYQLESFSFGLTQFERVRDYKRVSGYICKYITKDMHTALKGRKKYLCSRGLARADVKTVSIDLDKKLEFITDNFPDYNIVYFNNSQYLGKQIQYLQLKRRENA